MNAFTLETVPRRDLAAILSRWPGGRLGLIVTTAGVVALPALWLGWPWLVAAGVAPLLVAFAPCALMCAVGLCAMKSGSKSVGTAVTVASAQAGIPLTEPGGPVPQATAVPMSSRAAACCDSPAGTEAAETRQR